MEKNLNARINGLYAITPEEPDTARLLNRVRMALLGGARIVQYRNKRGSANLRLEQAHALRALTCEFSATLIINDDAKLAREVDADGVHLGGNDGSVSDARDVLGHGKIIGVSCYNQLNLARRAEAEGADYVAFGAFFASTVKPGAVVATPGLLQQARAEINLPRVAIGGITTENGNDLLRAGASALAVISALFSAADITLAARQFTNLNFQKDAT